MGMDFRVLVWKRVWKMAFFGLKSGQDLKNRAAHSHREFPGAWPRRWSKILTSPRSISDKSITVGLIWEACWRTSITFPFAKRLRNLETTGFGPSLSFLVDTGCTVSMSKMDTSAPISWKSLTQKELVSGAVSSELFSGRPIILTLNW